MPRGLAGMTAVAAGALLIAATPASGALSYVMGPNTTTGAGAQGSASVDCPASTFVIGGGAFASGGFETVMITTSSPSGNARWTEDTDVYSGTQVHRAYAICDTTMPTLAFKSRQIPTAEERRARAECPPGLNVYGGGYLAGPNFGTTNTRGSRPYDGADPDKDRDDGWEATVFNLAPTPTETLAYAECGPRSSTTRTTTSSIGPRSQKVIRKGCPEGDRVTGGGAYTTGGRAHNWISSTWPTDAGDQDTLPDDRWSAYLENDTDKRREIQAYVVCR